MSLFHSRCESRYIGAFTSGRQGEPAMNHRQMVQCELDRGHKGLHGANGSPYLAWSWADAESLESRP